VTINNYNQTTKISLIKAFPSALFSDVEKAIKYLPASKLMPAGNIGAITLNKEQLFIPHHIYYPEPDFSVTSTLNSTQQAIIFCVYTRHHDGLIREKYLKNIISINELWVLPFVFALVGEYVIEINEVIHNNLGVMNKEQVQLFAQENKGFITLTRQRVLTYWGQDYHWEICFKNHPGYRVMSELGLWNSHDGRRLLRPTK
jgi:hypothetical protein